MMYFQKILFSKKFLACIFCFGLFTKIKRGLGLVFSAYFLHTFSIKMFFIKYLLVDQVLMSILLSFSRYQMKWVFKFLFSQLVTSWNLEFEFDHLHKQWLTEKKELKRKIQKCEYFESENEINLIKRIFHNCFWALIWWKIMASKIQARTANIK